MGTIGTDNKVKLFCGIISADKDIEEAALKKLTAKFQDIDQTSIIVDFDYSNYYESEMGKGLRRFWVSFDKLIFSQEIADIKVFTNSIEDEFSAGGRRIINIDPGYLTAASIVLATTKNFSHRIYLSKGIYAEITSIYKAHRFIKLPWSYPDYMSDTALSFFENIRQIYLKQLKAKC
jgi:hypothetical protein